MKLLNTTVDGKQVAINPARIQYIEVEEAHPQKCVINFSKEDWIRSDEQMEAIAVKLLKMNQ